VVVAVIFGVVKLAPVNIEVPPDAFAYQFIVPKSAVAESVTLPEPHLSAGVVVIIEGELFTVAITAVLLETQLLLFAST